MKGRIVAGIVAAAIGSTAAASAENPSGAVYVTTLPSDADVWVDGTYVGHAPVLVDALAPGHHSLTITKTGWVVREIDVTVTSGDVAMSSTRLQPGPRALAGSAVGSVVVRAVPAGAQLQLDGAPFTLPSGPLTLPAGPHRIVVQTGRGRTTHGFNVVPDTTTDVVLVEPRSGAARSAVVAPAEDYLPTDAFAVEGNKIVVRYGGHVVVAHIGEMSVRYDGATLPCDSAPQSIAGKLYLSVQLLEKLTDDASNGH